MVAVILAVGGIVLFAYEDGFKGSGRVDSAIGVVLSVGSAIGAASYKVRSTLLKQTLMHEYSYTQGRRY